MIYEVSASVSGCEYRWVAIQSRQGRLGEVGTHASHAYEPTDRRCRLHVLVMQWVRGVDEYLEEHVVWQRGPVLWKVLLAPYGRDANHTLLSVM